MSDETELSRLHLAAASLIAEFRTREAARTPGDDVQMWRDRVVEVCDMLTYVADTSFEVVSLRHHFEHELAILAHPCRGHAQVPSRG